MSRLQTRGPAKGDYFTTEEAQEFIQRARQSHAVRWRANVYRWMNSGGAEELLMKDVPLLSGRLTMDSSDINRRKLSAEVGGDAALEPLTWNDPLVPFGQFIRLWMTIDRANGSWFPWLQMGEFAVQTHVYERPSQITSIEAVDHSAVVNEYLHTVKTSYSNAYVASAIDRMVKDALPDSAYKLVVDPLARSTRVPHNWVADAGSPRWEEALKIAETMGFDTFFDWAGDLVIRPSLGDGQEDIIPDVGPDIGTVTNPIMNIAAGRDGALIGMTSTVTREGGANGVFINIHETADQKDKAKRGDRRVDVQVRATAGAGSPVEYGNRFGRIPVVIDKNVAKITDQVVEGNQWLANQYLSRRRGVVRYIDFDMVGGYWVEPDDRVKLKFGGGEEDHYVQSIEFDLKGGPTRCRTRSLNVIDPGARR